MPSRFKSVIKALFDVAARCASRRRIADDEIFEKALGRYYTRADAAHYIVRTTAPVGLKLEPMGAVQWSYLWPITSDELIWQRGEGAERLAVTLDEAGIDAFDLGRKTLEGVPLFDPWRRA